MEQPPIFNSVEDECRYWKERAKLYHKEWTDVKQEFDEFVEDSRQLEAEMEATLEQKETAIRDLRKQVIQLEKENESLRVKSDSHSIEFSELEKQLAASQSEKDALKSYLRQLEQKNDDLERAHRILVESISGLKTMLDKEYERNALESDEKELLKERLQRLMDERRDLEQELNVRHRVPSNNMNGSLDHSVNGGLESPPPAGNSSSSGIADFGQHSLKNPDNILNGNAMTASSRTTALNIVADMLRKLNLDKTLLCSRCDKFRCICDRPVSLKIPPKATAYSPNETVSLQMITSPPNCNNNSTNNIPNSTPVATNNSSSNLFGTNIFQRFSMKNSGIGLDSPNNNAMESKLKAYREQVPPPRQ